MELFDIHQVVFKTLPSTKISRVELGEILVICASSHQWVGIYAIFLEPCHLPGALIYFSSHQCHLAILLYRFFGSSFLSPTNAPSSFSLVGRTSGLVSDKIFIATGSEVKGYSKKGNNFLTLDTNLAESLQSM